MDGPFAEGVVKGINNNRKLEEASGLVASRRNPGLLWAHNDSGHRPELFLLDSLGQTLQTFRILGAHNRDWEDITIGVSSDSINYIFVGDIGDNYSNREIKLIYCIAEPLLGDPEDLPVINTLKIRLADKNRDCETLMHDPLSQNLYLISKREENVMLYEIKFPFAADTLTAEPIRTLPIQSVVAGDITPDGTEIVIKSYNHIYYWRRLASQSLADALQTPMTELSYIPEPQGESIAWSIDGSGFFTLSENGKGERARLLFYQRLRPADSSMTTGRPLQ